MVQIGGNLRFPGWSGLIESLQNSITLRASTSGDVIIGQNNGLLPEIDLVQDLGRADLRWENLWSASGTFDSRPTVGGINVALVTELAGQTILNGISGAITLNSPDDSVNVNVNGQNIEITTPTSGAPSGASYLLREYNDNGHLTSARILSATSGIILDDQGTRSLSGLVIKLDFENEPVVGQVLKWNGARLEWENDGTGGGGGGGVEEINGISGTITLDSPNESININVNGQSIELTTPTSGAPSGASYLLREYNDNGHLTTARILSATSGLRLDDQGTRSTSGLVVTLDFDNEPSGANRQELTWNGSQLEWANRIRKTIKTFTVASGLEFVLEHGLDVDDFNWSMWRTDGTPEEVLIPDNIYSSGLNHAVVVFTPSDSDPNGYTGKVVFMG